MQVVEAPGSLRGWQLRALVKYLAARPRDFLAVATPGAGKTTFALRIVAELLAEGTVETVTIVVPTEHLKNQWATAAAKVGIARDKPLRAMREIVEGMERAMDLRVPVRVDAHAGATWFEGK